MKCNYKKQLFIILLFAFVVTSTFARGGGRGGGGRSSSSGSRSRGSGSSSGGGSSGGGGFFSRIFGGSKSSSGSTGSSPSSSNSGSSYPKQTYNTGSGTHTNTNYGWNTGGNKYNSGNGHYYNSPSSATNWGSSYNSPSYHSQPQSAFGSFHPVSSGIAPSYHFHRSTSYIPIYIPSSHTYIHRHYTNNDQSTSSSSTSTNNNPPPPPSEPVVYKEDSSSSFGESSKPTMIVGFNNMIVYGVYESDKHYVITVSDDLDEDIDDIPEKFLRMEDSNLFDIVTLKPSTTTTTTTNEPWRDTTLTSERFVTSEASTVVDVGTDDEWTTNWKNQSATLAALKFVTSIDKETTTTNYFRSNDEDEKSTSGADVDDVLNLYFGDIILR